MSSRIPLVLAFLLVTPFLASAQTRPTEGLRENPPGVHALVGARVVVAPGRTLESATVVVRNGVIEAVGTDARPPADARIWDLGGHTLYPGFIDAYADVGMPGSRPEDLEQGAIHWNPQVRSFVDAASAFDAASGTESGALRAQGITVAMAVPRLGMFRGRTAAVSLGGGAPGDRMLRTGIAHSLALTRDNRLGGGYPTSAMGGVALIRQVFLDADWYAHARAAYERQPAGSRRPETNLALEALVPALNGGEPVLVETRTEEELLRAVVLADEFGLRLWVRGSGMEYRIADVLAAAPPPLILPVAFPTGPSIETPEAALAVSLAQLRHRYLAPENPARLAAAGVDFAFTADGLQNPERFLDNVRRAVARGLPADRALAALTTVPARYLGIQATHGTLEAGKAANIVVVDGDLFDEGAEIRDVWIDGERFEIQAPPAVDPRGRWLVTLTSSDPVEASLTLDGSLARLSGSFAVNGEEVRLASANLRDEARRLYVTVPGSALGLEGRVRLSGTVAGDEIHGWGELPDGGRLSWYGVRAAGELAGDDGSADGDSPPAGRARERRTVELADIRPAMEYGRPAVPEQPDHVLVRNATIWTQGPQGIVEDGDLLVRRGRVVEVGTGLTAPAGAVVIDATGRHVTPGLIDAHLHAGVTGGVNETGSATVPEVRIGDVLTMNNIWTYRQLAGGLTTAHVMHGSANPIGGQNQHVKMRWGALPEDLKLAGAPRTVKFALGENVVRREGRYPDTRMGTEQIVRDHFQAAREYEAAWRAWEEGGRRGIRPRRDLRLEALVDILNGDILVMSHSYRQDEILMLTRLAEEFDVRIQAFHHGVETYKVAPELARHGAGAIVWSDWSSFKIEAYDATTFNARLLTDAGVLTSLHSDDSQVATRMNWEAAKMLRTGMGEEAALALVTSNTARLLGIDDRVGSLEPGKDADFVIWTGHPLSTFSRAEQTWVDGRKYFDLEEDARARREVERERAQLIQWILDERPGRGGES